MMSKHHIPQHMIRERDVVAIFAVYGFNRRDVTTVECYTNARQIIEADLERACITICAAADQTSFQHGLNQPQKRNHFRHTQQPEVIRPAYCAAFGAVDEAVERLMDACTEGQ